MSDDKTILFISMASGDALRAAKRLGLRVAMVTDLKLTWQSQYVDEVIAVTPFDQHQILDIVVEYSERHRLSAVTTFDERCVPVTAHIADRLKLPGNTYEAAYAARNKFVMRSRFAEQGLACPGFAIVRTLDEAEAVARDKIQFPLVLKPLFGFASQGVLRVNQLDELREAFPIVKRVAESHKVFVGNDAYGDCVLLEEYLSGREVAVDGLLHNGVTQWFGIFDKPNPLEGPTFEETIYVTPSIEDKQLQGEILAEVERGARALGLQTGPLHAEVRITDNGLRLVEIGARAVGGVCARAHTYCLGFDYAEYVLRSALGEFVESQQKERTPSGVMMLPVPGTGRLVSVSGIEEAQSVEGVRDVFVMAKPGDTIKAFPEQGCYIGFILASGANTKEVEESLNKSHLRLRFELEAIETSGDGGAVQLP
jgi:biotin carboxylase